MAGGQPADPFSGGSTDIRYSFFKLFLSSIGLPADYHQLKFVLFIRWKPLDKQPIGWDPDFSDGVRLNVYPFVQAEVLRRQFNVKWGKDRGKNPSGSPWSPERWNRYEGLDDEWKLKDEKGKVVPHLTNEVKRKKRVTVG